MNNIAGGFILHGQGSLDWVFPGDLTPVAHGNFLNNTHCEGDLVTPETVGSYRMVGTVQTKILSPVRNSSLLHWCSGPTATIEIPHRLLTLNAQERVENLPYREIVLNLLPKDGRWAFVTAHLTMRSNIIICARNSSLYCWVIRYRGQVILLWSCNPSHMEQVLSLMTNEHDQNEVLALPIEVCNSLFIVNTLHAIGRFKQAWHTTFQADRLSVISFMYHFFRRKFVPLTRP